MIIHLFVTTAVISLVQIPTGAYAYEGYLVCGTPIRSANLEDIGYPFWGSSRPSCCGHPAFKLNCSGEVPEITIMSVNYLVLRINYKARTLCLALPDDRKEPCPAVLVNSSLDTSLFNYASGTTQAVLYYDCQRSDNLFGSIYPFNCNSSQRNGSNYYAVQRGFDHTVPIGCKDIVFIYATNLYQSDNLSKMLNNGFDLEWKANDSLCKDCQASGGQCGHSSTFGEFACYCKDNRSYPFACRMKDENFLNCTNSLCGGHLYDIGFPFWGGNRPEYCGHPDFKLDCSASPQAEIEITSKKYQVLVINQTSHTLRVSLQDYIDTYVCPASPPHNFTSSFIGSNFLNYPSYNQELTFFYNCRSPNASLKINTSYNCNTSTATDVFNFFDLKGERYDQALADVSRTCGGSAVILVSKSEYGDFSSYTHQSGWTWSLLNDFLKDNGFWLEWKLPKNASSHCDACQTSGGRCGYNTTSAEFSCYCKDRTYPITCGSYFGTCLFTP